MISNILQEFTIMSSLEKPKKISFIGADSKEYNFLMKLSEKNEFRKEARCVDVLNHVNLMFVNDQECKKWNLYLDTYYITILHSKCGMIEWVSGTSTVKHIIRQPSLNAGIKPDFELLGYMRAKYP